MVQDASDLSNLGAPNLSAAFPSRRMPGSDPRPGPPGETQETNASSDGFLHLAVEHTDAFLLAITVSLTRLHPMIVAGLGLSYTAFHIAGLRNPTFKYRRKGGQDFLFAVSLCPVVLGSYGELTLLSGVDADLQTLLVSLGSGQFLLDFAFANTPIMHCAQVGVLSAIGAFMGLSPTSALTFLSVQKLLSVVIFKYWGACFSPTEGVFWAQALAMFCTVVQADHNEDFMNRSPAYVFSSFLICFELMFVALTALFYIRPPRSAKIGPECAPLCAGVATLGLFLLWLVIGVGGWIPSSQLLGLYPTPGAWFLAVLLAREHQSCLLQWVLALASGIGIIQFFALKSLALNGLNRVDGQDAANFERELEHLVRAQQEDIASVTADASGVGVSPPVSPESETASPSRRLYQKIPTMDEVDAVSAAQDGIDALNNILKSEQQRHAPAMDRRTSEDKAETARVRILYRKAFHALAVVLFGPPLLAQQADFLGFSMLIATLLMFTVEVCRVCRCPWLACRADRFMDRFVEDRDGMVVHHIYLLVGCAIPVWLHCLSGDAGSSHVASGPFTSLPVNTTISMPAAPSDIVGLVRLRQASGVLLVGIGDAFAAVCGVSIGQIKWPHSHRTVEGWLAFVVSVSLTVLVSTSFVNASDPRQLNVFRVAILLTAFLESYTQNIDNIVLPLYFCPTFKALCEASL